MRVIERREGSYYLSSPDDGKEEEGTREPVWESTLCKIAVRWQGASEPAFFFLGEDLESATGYISWLL